MLPFEFFVSKSGTAQQDGYGGTVRFRVALLLVLSLLSGNAWTGERVSFPPDFRWCVATAAHQIEGGNFNSDMWDWEQVPGHVRNGDTSRVAYDHWNRVDEDIGLMKFLNVRAYRFSVEWAKLEPEEGVYDEAAIAHYRNEVASLQA